MPFENTQPHNTAGTIAMASTAPGMGGSSQFYINLVDNSKSLDGNYAVFGQVINGMSVVKPSQRSPSTRTRLHPSIHSRSTLHLPTS